MLRFSREKNRHSLFFLPKLFYTLQQICEKLGWKGKGGRFDVLPWILQANGEDPDFYDVPEELVLEVKITHPELV